MDIIIMEDFISVKKIEPDILGLGKFPKRGKKFISTNFFQYN
jgi:hypothetical protein